MSRFLTRLQDGTLLEEIESMGICKHRISLVCCNEKCEEVGDYPDPHEKCEGSCEWFEAEDGILFKE